MMSSSCKRNLLPLAVVSFIVIVKLNVVMAHKISEHPVIIVVSFDGFRYDYLKRINATSFDELASKGVTVPYLRNQFITKTFPNHQSIATGLHAESHGVVDNSAFDPKFGKNLGEEDGEIFWNFDDDILPVWTLNELAGEGRRSGVMMWPGSPYPYGKNKTLPTRIVKWNESISWEWRVDTAISWIVDHENPVNLVFMYFEDPDEIAHAFGPESSEVTGQIQRVNNITGYMIQELKANHIYDRVNLMILSDHGFETVHQNRIINITHVLDADICDRYGGSPVLQVNPKEGHLDHLYEVLKNESAASNFTVFKKSDIHSYWHYTSNRRIMPLILVPDLGYVFDDFYEHIDWYNSHYNLTANASRTYGAHGWDNRWMQMHAFFMAHGPLFQSGVQVEPFDNVDIFPFICHVLGIPTPPNNGTLSRVNLLKMPPNRGLNSPVGWVVGAAVIVGLTIVFGILSFMVARTRDGSFGREDGYRFIQRGDVLEVSCDEEMEEVISVSRPRPQDPQQDITTDLYHDKRQVFQNGGNTDEIQALLLSSSSEEL